MDRVIDSELYEMFDGYPPTNGASFPSFTTAPAITTTITTAQAHVPSNNNQMLGDWGLDAIATFDASMSHSPPPPQPLMPQCLITALPPTTTTTFIPNAPAIPANNKQMLNDWGLDVMVNRYIPPTIDTSIPSFTTTAFTPTTPANNNQMLGDWGLDLGTHMGWPNNSLSSSAVATPTPTTFMPTITNTRVMHNQTPHLWDMANSSSSVFAATTPSTPTFNNPNCDGAYRWKQHTMVNSFSSTNIGGSSSSFLGPTFPTPSMPTPTNVNYQQNSSFQGEINLHQPLINSNVNSIKHFMQTSNNTLNAPKTPLSSQNWPILTLPCYGKLTATPTHKQQQNRVQRRQEISKSTNTNAQSSSESSEWKKEKRIYKMPLHAVKNDIWSWRKYGEKSVDGSPYPRVYYKCDSSKECAAKRRVEQNRYSPDFAILKYTGHHNHPMPTPVNSSIGSAIRITTGNDDSNNSSSSKAISLTTTTTVNSKMNKDDIIFEGLDNFVDLEKGT